MNTCIPEVVKYGISNLTCIGGFPSVSSAVTLGSPKWALIKYSFPPGKDLIDQITADCSGAYLQWPIKNIHIYACLVPKQQLKLFYLINGAF